LISLARQPWCVASALLVPWFSLGTPDWLKLAGVAPAWAVLWLLPWALVDGPVSGTLAGLGVGLMQDALHPGPLSTLPALVLLGWWWGRLGRRSRIQRSFNLGLLALLGSALLAGSLILQQRLWQLQDPAAWHTLLAQSLLTAVLAPVLCSLQLRLWRSRSQAFLPVPALRR
jgi:rod shape-determining protein MreD